ncbi:MAG: AMP-binding protein [Geobacteraceae bacterium]|nr:AMP-binding protein [Geobacteraceae bacterium]
MTTIDALLQESFARHAGRTALRHKEGGAWHDISYGELHSRCERVSAGLFHSGFGAGDRAAIMGPSSADWISAYVGTLRIGGIVVPVDKDLKSSELRHVLTDCEARVIFVAPEYLETLLEIVADLSRVKRIVLLQSRSDAGEYLSQELALLRDVEEELKLLLEILPLSPEQDSKLRDLAWRVSGCLDGASWTVGEINEIDDPLSPNETAKKELLRSGRLLALDEFVRESPPPPSSHKPGDTALILYTSGTTGRSKGALLSHGNIVSNIRGAASHFRLDSTMHTLSFLPINHVFEQVCGVFLPLSLGGKVSFAESLKKLGENLVEVRPTFFTGVPAVYRLFHDRIMKKIRSGTLSNLLFSLPIARRLVMAKVRKNFAGDTTFISGGAALDPAIAAGLLRFGLTLYQGYGITETSPVISAECPGRTRLGSVGPLLEEVDVQIEGADEEGVGEILVRGPNVMQGYFKNPHATAEVLAGGWYHTGDLGRLDRDGFLYVCGRVKNLIVTPNGKNVYPEEVENELIKSRFIAEAMVYGHRIDAVSEEVHAIIFPDQDALDDYQRAKQSGPMNEADVEELIRGEVRQSSKNLADYKRVKKFTIREDEFPKTTTRKIKRFAVEADIAIG